jgi:hypothetical protein
MRTICPAHLSLLDFITLTTICEEYNLWSSSVCSLLYLIATSSLLGPNIALSTLFSNTPMIIRRPFGKFVDSPYYSSRNFVEVRWRSLFRSTCLGKRCTSYDAPPMLQTVDHFEISCLGAPFSWSEKPRNRMGRDLDCMTDVLKEYHQSTFSNPKTEFNSDPAPCDFWVFPTMKREIRGKKFRRDQRSVARFRELGGAL